MVPPPPPPPPPPPGSSVALPSWRETAAAQRTTVQSSPKPPSVQSQRPSVDAEALQHAATRLRKTQHGQSVRSDEPRVSDGRVDGQNQCTAGRDWQNGQKQQPMGIDQTREEIPSPSPHPDFTRSIGNVRRPSHSLNTDSSPQRFVSTTTFSSSDYSVPTRNNNSIPSYSSSLPFSSPFASSSYASPYIQSTTSSSSWVSQIDNTLREHTASPHFPSPASTLYAVPTRISPQPTRTSPANNNDGLLYSAINKTSTTSSSPPLPAPPSHLSSVGRPDFARELRDQGLTERQRAANEQKSGRRLEPLPIDAASILQASKDGDEISRLVNQMSAAMGRATPVAAAVPPLPTSAPPRPVHSPSRTATTTTTSVVNRQMGQSLRGNVCVNCNQEITNDKPGCTALNQIFHVSCFVCSKCGDQLAGSSFYNVDGKPICEKDYVDSLERCAKCSQPISDRLLRAVGGAFHVQCFTCVVCNIALDGIPFTVDPENRVHCVPCFHEAFAPRCAVCSKPIVPQDGEKESVRVVAMEKSFHVECYRCEDCGTQLSSKVEGQGCYPLDSHLYCKTCNGNRLRLLASS